MTDDATQRMAKLDDSGCDGILFDEIYFVNVHMLAKIKRHSENNPKKIILATGVTNQLGTVDLVSNQLGYETYVVHCQRNSPHWGDPSLEQALEDASRQRNPSAAQGGYFQRVHPDQYTYQKVF